MELLAAPLPGTESVTPPYGTSLALALVHSAVGMKAANDLIAQAGRVDAAGSTVVTAAVLAVIYGGYFLATALACRRMALEA